MDDTITIDTDDPVQTIKTLFRGLAHAQLESLQYGDVDEANEVAEEMTAVIEQNPDLARNAVKELVKDQTMHVRLPEEMAETLDMDADEWGIFHSEEDEGGGSATGPDFDSNESTSIDIE
jgi:hypothetical protein